MTTNHPLIAEESFAQGETGMVSGSRRRFLYSSAGLCLAAAMHGCIQSQNTVNSGQQPSGAARKTLKMKVGSIPITPALPLFVAEQKGLFEQEGLDLEIVRFQGVQQVVEALIAGRLDGSSTGTAFASLAAAEIASPGLFKIIASDVGDARNIVDSCIVGKNSPIQKIADLKDGANVACGLGIQLVAIAKAILRTNGIQNANLTQLSWDQHPSALASGQFAASFTIEPVATAGKLKGLTRTIDANLVSKYILQDPMAPRFGGPGIVRIAFLKDNPDAVKKFLSAYRQAVEVIRKNPAEARSYLQSYTPIKAEVAETMPLPGFKLYDEYSESDFEVFSKVLRLFLSGESSDEESRSIAVASQSK